jgi:hypothetical protein
MILNRFYLLGGQMLFAKLTLIPVLFSSELVENRKIIGLINKQKFVI